MSKAILVLDEMPETCYECKYHMPVTKKRWWYCALTNETLYVAVNRRHKSCPLRPMPEQHNIPIKHPYGYLYNDGWNACLKVIGGNNE